MAGGDRPEHGDRRDERPLRSRAVRTAALVAVSACVGVGAFGGVGAAAPKSPKCPPGTSTVARPVISTAARPAISTAVLRATSTAVLRATSTAARQTPGLPVAVAITALLLWLAFSDGGFFPTTWNTGALVLLWLVVVVLVAPRHVAPGRFGLAPPAGPAPLALLTGLSALWSIAPAASLLEAQRTLFYLAAAAVLLLLFRPRDARAVAAAITASVTIVSGYALIDRLVAVNPLPYFRLGGPVGYWNTLGVLAAAGVCLAVSLIAHERHRAVRAAAGCAVPILIAALYLTFSRGSWAALVVGLAVIAATDARRRELAGAVAAVALPSAVVVGCGALADALTTPVAPQAAVEADAHRYAIAILFACAASAALAVLAPRLGARLPGFSFRRVAAAAIVCAAVVGVVVAGGPRPLATGAARAFDAPPPSTSAGLGTHVVSLSGSLRGQLWKVAATSFADRPLNGS